MLRCIKIIPGAADQRDIKLIPINIWVTPNNWRGLKALRFKPSDEQIILLKKFIPVGDFPGYEAWKLLAAQNRYMSQQTLLPWLYGKKSIWTSRLTLAFPAGGRDERMPF